MKKLLMLLIGGLLLVSCSESEAPYITTDANKTPQESVRSLDEVIAIAHNAIEISGSQARSGKSLTKEDIVVVANHRSSRNEQADTAIYAVNIGDDNGFVLVAAPRACTNPLIGIVENGTYSNDILTEDSNFGYFMNQAIQYAITPVDSGFQFEKFYYEEVFYSLEAPIIHKTVEWGNNWPENMFCSNYISGCVTVAIAEALAFFKTPAGIFINYENADKAYQILSWESINKIIATNEVNPSTTFINQYLKDTGLALETLKSLGRLIREIGNLADCNYLPNLTGSKSYGNTVLKQLLGNSASYKEGWKVEELFDLFSTNGTKPCLALIGGKSYVYLDDQIIPYTGHTWLADGFMSSGILTKRYDRTTKELIAVIDERTKYLHMNWGMSGKFNGNFLIDVLNPTRGYDDAKNPMDNGDVDDKYNVRYLTIDYTFVE